MNNPKLGDLLTIPDKKNETIFDVVGRMKVLLEFFKRNSKYKNFVPFLKTYYLITKSVAERRLERRKYFADSESLDKLDAHFADLYFQPLKAYLLNGKLRKPWQTYFRYCSQKNGVPFLQMLLGINAHINSDLLTSLVHLKYRNRKDFLVINKILQEEIPDVMKFLIKVDHDLYGLGVLIFRDFAISEFKHVIVKWRERVWQNSMRISKKRYLKIRPKVHAQTEKIGEEIVKVFEKLAHLRDVTRAVSEMNRLEINV